MSFPVTHRPGPGRVETYQWAGDDVVERSVQRRDGSVSRSTMQIPEKVRDAAKGDAHSAFDKAWLQSDTPPSAASLRGEIRVVDLFAGCGGLSLGISEACRALGLRMTSVAANDIDGRILEIYRTNFGSAVPLLGPVEERLLDGEIGSPPTELELRQKELVESRGRIHLVIGGPPCQGHSNFNNHTRHNDPKNALYLRMARFCEVYRPDHVIIENVPGVEKDQTRAAERTRERLIELGYRWEQVPTVIDASRIGVAQKRKRSITIGSLAFRPSIAAAVSEIELLRGQERPVAWAIGDLTHFESDALIDTPSRMSPANQARVAYLHKHGQHNLPDENRPDCHRLKPHRYQAVYGRMRPDLPAPTITTGFGSLGRGRFGHPERPRTITPHEAARIQFFPDFFKFEPGSRTLIQKVIGNAVPPKLGYALGLHLLR